MSRQPETVWSRLGVQRTPGSVPKLLTEVAAVTVATGHRYVWRGVKDARYDLHTSLARRLTASGMAVTAETLCQHDAALVQRARDARVDNHELSDAELLALLQHAGASTSLLDVTPDPFVALFFATEPVGSIQPCALMAIRVPGATWLQQVAHTYQGPLPDRLGRDVSVHGLLCERLALDEATDVPILWEAPFLDNRMRAQRGMFLATTAPATGFEHGSFDPGLSPREVEKVNVAHLINGDRGAYNRPPLIAFYIPQAMRVLVARELDKRFGYRTETIYPDLAGFALANAATRVM